MINKRLINTGVEAAPAAFDPLQNFETVTYTGNGSTQKITGYIRKGAAFNGSANITTSLDFDNLTDYSISLWLYADSSGFFAGTINSSGTSGLWLQLTSGNNVNFTERTAGGTSYAVTSTGTITANAWNHIVAVRDGSTNYLYINNGSPDSTSNASITHATDFTLGRAGAFTSSLITGKIDQVRIFDKALSSGEVTTLYGETYASSTKSTTDIFGDGSGVALYELDEDAGDTGNLGTAIDAGQSAVFNGTNSALTANRMFSTASSYSISFWAKMAAGTTTENCYFWQISGTTQRALMVNYSGSGTDYGFSFNHKGATNTGQSNIVTFVPDGNWHHFTGTFNSSTSIGTLYIDGVQKDLFNLDAVSDTGSTLYMGGSIVYNNVQSYFPLSGLDQIRIYDTALSSSDVTNLYNETNVPTTNLVAHYKLDGNANDETGSYNGTATNITYSDPAYTGQTQYNGTPTNVNFLGMAFQPDLVWIKNRDAAVNHKLLDSIRFDGTNYEVLESNTTAISAATTQFSSFDSNGFTLGGGASAYNGNGVDYVAWCWKSGGAAVSNTDGSITSTVSVNPDAGFSIVKYTGDRTSGTNQTVGHGLSSAPELVIAKRLTGSITSTNGYWAVYSSGLSSASYYLKLNETAAEFNDSAVWGGVAPTSSVFTIRDAAANNFTGESHIAYCFHSVDGYQKVGSYTGTGSAGNVINVGFKPRFLLWKKTNGDVGWFILDGTRNTSDVWSARLEAHNSNAESGPDSYTVTVSDTGFEMTGSFASWTGSNELNSTYIYLAIA